MPSPMAKKRKRQRKRLRRVPAALRRVYGDLVQTLEAAILSLLPPPPSSPTECRCRGRLCLGCGTPAYLLRQDDPPDYRILLTRGLCVLSCDAPPPPRVFHGDDAPQRVVSRNPFPNGDSSRTLELYLVLGIRFGWLHQIAYVNCDA